MRSKRNKYWSLQLILDEFNRSGQQIKYIPRVLKHYSCANSAQTSFQAAINKYGLNMVAKMRDGVLVLIKRGADGYERLP